MKKILLIVLAAGLLAPAPADARRKKKKTETAAATAKPKETTQKGLFTVTKSGENWFFEIPDSLVGRKFLTTTRFTATPANCGKFAGEQVNQQTVYWQVAPTGDKLLLRADLLVHLQNDDLAGLAFLGDEGRVNPHRVDLGGQLFLCQRRQVFQRGQRRHRPSRQLQAHVGPVGHAG